MLLRMLALTVLLTGSAQAAEAPDPDIAPSAPAWPADRPDPLKVPLEATCVTDKGDVVGVGVYLPDRLAGIINGRLEALSAFPSRCQLRMDWLKDRCALDVRRAADIARAEAGANELQEELGKPTGWPTLYVVGVAVSVGIVALASGYLAGRVSR